MIGLQIDQSTGLPEFNRSVWNELDGQIAALQSSVVIDSVPLADFTSLKYIMSFKGATQDDVRTLEMLVQQRDGSIKEQVFGKSGQMNMSLDTTINGSSFELQLSNPENFSVDYVLTVLTI